MVEGRPDLSSNIDKFMDIIMGQIWDQSQVNYPLKGILKQKVQENGCHHDTDHIAQAKLQHLVELHEKSIGKLAINELDCQGSNQG